MRHTLPILLVLSSTPAFAQAADSAGAEALQANLARYMGTTIFDKGVITIGLDGDAYKVDVDFGKLMTLFPAQDSFKLEVDPYVLRLRPRADSTWDVAGDMLPDGKIAIKADNTTSSTEWTSADDSFEGVYDPRLAGFAVAEGRNGEMTMISTDPTSQSEFKSASGSFIIQSTKNATRGVDFNATQALSDMEQKMTVPVAEGAQPISVVMRSPELSYVSTATGFQSQELLDLLAFFVANPDEAKLKAAQPQLKTLLRSAMPLWNDMTGSYNWRELSVGTPVGIFSAANAKIAVEMGGIRKDGTVTYRFAIDDLAVPNGLLPSWSAKLMPEDINLDVGGVGIDLEGPATAAIDALDLNQDPPIPEAVGDAIVAKFIANPPKFVLNRSVLSNKDTEIIAEGEMTFMDGKPAMTATLEATGFDNAVQALQEASATYPEAQQMQLVALAAKGFAKTLADGKLQWVVDMKADGAVTVNGALVKPADPVEPAPQ
ncbi:MAG: hypothetical protein JNK47_22665 [Mesorhizobium sp.]|nr:hypothetical protein [Mesorhizobium sp.]MBL8580017.1 hypothetical protein [Mesorhizobium sp.]